MKNIQCKNCGHLHNGWCKPKIDSPDPHLIRDCGFFRQKTNMDIVKHSDANALAERICDSGVFCVSCERFGDGCDQCRQRCTEWLMKEVFDDGSLPHEV